MAQASGIWIRFRRNGEWGEPRWLSMSRDWFMEIRVKIGVAWRTKFGMSAPGPGFSTRTWVLSELDRMGVRLIGDDLRDLPAALSLEILTAKDGDAKTGPKGEWEKWAGLSIRGLPPRSSPGRGIAR
jgi:hypothetical protein